MNNTIIPILTFGCKKYKCELENINENTPQNQKIQQKLQKPIDKEEYQIAPRIRDKIKDFDG